jgi:endonuclease-3
MVVSSNENIVIEVLKRLESVYRPKLEDYVALNLLKLNVSDFEFLVGVVLSQNTSDRNALRAFNALKKELGNSLSPESILNTPLEKLENAIKCSGLARRRVRALIALAKWFKENSELIERLRVLKSEEIRKLLMEVYGIGPKTVDVYILMKLGKPAFPIDTHIRRILLRLGVVPKSSSYNYVSTTIMSILNNDVTLLKELHVLLIEHGRRVCKARKPLCKLCVLIDLCQYGAKMNSQ